MRKTLQQNKEAGFYLTYTVFISMIIFTTLTTSLVSYHLNMLETEKLMELTKKETLIQMAKESFKQSYLHNDNETGKVNYTYPDGEVEVQYEEMQENIWELTMKITTTKNSEFHAYYLLPFEAE